MQSTLRAHLALFSVALIYGANYSIAKLVMDDGYIPPLAFILMRVVTAAFLFWCFHLLFIRERVRWADLGRMALCGLFGVAINQTFFFSGLRLTTPINASLIMTMTPILVLLLSALLIAERVTRRKVLGIGLGATGAAWLIAHGQRLAFSSEQLLGNLMVLINATSYGLYLVLVKRLMQDYHPITVVKWVFTFGMLVVVPLGLPGLQAIRWGDFDAVVWLAVAYVLFCTTFLAYLFNAYALSRVQPSVVSIYIYLQPVLATTIALALGKDRLEGVHFLSAALIFAGVFLVSTRSRRKVSS